MGTSQLNKLVVRERENKLAHAFLLETNDVDKCYLDVLNLLKQINCPFEFCEDCKNEDCNLCNLIDTDNLPSLITISPEGQYIKKDQILSMMMKYSTKPVFSKYNMYIVKNADRFNSSSANTLLKFLEEPEDNILGFFITNNVENVISTVRSRCQIIYCNYDSMVFDADDEVLDNVKIYLNGIINNKEDLLFNKTNMVGLYTDRSDWEIFFYSMLHYFRECYYDRIGKIDILNSIDKKNYVNIIVLIENIIKYIKSNGNIDLILDKFVIEMRAFYE